MTIRTRYEQLKDKNWLVEQYVTKERSAPDIAEEIGCFKDAVYRALKKHGIQRRPGGGVKFKDYPELRDKAWLEEEYINQHRVGSDIANQLGCSIALVYKALKEHGIKLRKGSPVGSAYPELQDRDWLYDQYITQLKSGPDIARKIGCTKHAVYRALDRHGIEKRGHTSRFEELNDRDWLYNAYIVEQRSLNDIADEVGSSAGNVASRLQTLGISRRDIPTAIRLARPEGWSGEKHHNWNGGRRPTVSGYIYVYAPDHPNATKAGYVMEHRLVAEECLGRLLEEDEIVHHLDGDKSNNDPENLQVMTRRDHLRLHRQAAGRLHNLQEEYAELEVENEELQERIAELEMELQAGDDKEVSMSERGAIRGKL